MPHRGSVRNYLTTDRDEREVIQGSRLVRRIMASARACSAITEAEMPPSAEAADR